MTWEPKKLTARMVEAGARVGVIDIENTTLNAGAGRLLSLAACHVLNYDPAKVKVFRIDEYHTDTTRYWYDAQMITDFCEYVKKEYEFVVTYNGDYHDIPIIAGRALHFRIRGLHAGMKHVNLYWRNKEYFKLANDSLAELTAHLSCKFQVHSLPAHVWGQAQCGWPAAIQAVVDHNINDVLGTAEATRALLQYGDLDWKYTK